MKVTASDDLHVLADANMAHPHALAVPPRTDSQERDAVAVFWIHVRLDLEHETGERLFVRMHHTLVRRARLRLRRILDEAIEHVRHAEVAERGAEEHRRDLPLEIALAIESVTRDAHQLDLFEQRVVFAAKKRARRRAIEPVDRFERVQVMAVPGGVAMDPVAGEFVDAAKETTGSRSATSSARTGSPSTFSISSSKVDRLANLAV